MKSKKNIHMKESLKKKKTQSEIDLDKKNNLKSLRVKITRRNQTKLDKFDKNTQNHKNVQATSKLEQTKVQPYSCGVCDKTLSSKTSLYRHIKQVHEAVRSFQCNLCSKSFISKEKLKNHLRVHSNKRAYKCEKCAKGFKAKSNLTRHNKYVHCDVKPFVCKGCDKAFKSKSALSKHISDHNDVNYCDENGKTPLMMSQNLTLIKILVEDGANVNAKDNDGNSVLMHAVCKENLEIVKYFIKLGADIWVENKIKETVLTKAIKSFLSYPGYMLPIIQYLLQHPALNENIEVLCRGANHPQKVLLLFDAPKYGIFFYQLNEQAETLLIVREEILQLLQLILHSQFKDTKMLETVKLQGHFIDMRRKVDMCSIVLFMYKRSKQIADLCVLQSCVQVFLDAGFDMKDGISPLTIFMLFWRPRYGDDDFQPMEIDVQEPTPTTPTTKFIKFLISHGAHVAQQMLPLRENIGGDFVALRAQLYLPDALFAAIIKGNVQAVRSLLPFWGFPALYVLLFTPLNDTFIFNSHLFAVLTEHGGVPHGTEMFRKLTRLLQHPNPLCGLFHNMQSSPLSLRELCRYQLRASLAPRASHADHSLPSMILELSPPGLKDFLLMQPSSHLELLKCHD